MIKYIPILIRHIIGAFLFLLFISSCGTKMPFYGNEYKDWEKAPLPPDSLLSHAIYLLGNTGFTWDNSPEHILALIYSDAGSTPDSLNTLIFLGDVSDQEDRGKIKISDDQIQESFNGNIFLIPGDKDWQSGTGIPQEQVKTVERQIEPYFDEGNSFLPDSACPGPREVIIDDRLVLLFVDSQWWLQPENKPKGSNSGCTVKDKFTFILQLEEMLERHEGKHILLVQHHPLVSNGNRGGFFSWKTHIFPFTSLNKNLYLPLPLVGSLYPILRNLGISRQDIIHPEYTALKEKMLSLTNELDHLVIATAHDFNLQYHKKERLHHILSGAATQAAYARKQNEAGFVHQHQGFAKLSYYKNGSSWLEFIVPEVNTKEGRVVFKTPLYALKPDNSMLANEELQNYTDSTNVLAAGPEYKAGKIKKWWLGRHYRNEWTTPVEVPLIDFKSENGGLEVVSKGGGNQTISLEVKGSSGIHHDLRSVNKNPAGAVPSPLHYTFAQDLVQDQISTAHPYGSLVIPRMADALGLYYTKPELFQIPYTPMLGKYMNDFSGMMIFKEVELDEDLSAYDRFGNSKNVVSENTLYEHLTEDNDNTFDAPMFLKARLFDMLIGDWDRHDGQWGFAEFEKENKGSLFQPIPKDRDQVFAKFDGVLPYLVSRKWAVRKFSHFDEDYNDLIGLNFNAQHIDRRLLSGLEWNDWASITEEIQEQLSDDIIEEALRDLPPEVYPISGPEIAATLKIRKQKLKEAAREYYLILAKEVDIVASDKHEFFLIERVDNGKTRIRSYKTQKEGEVNQQLYDRTFLEDETEEIRVYARDGKDSIIIEGNGESKSLVRIIGGEDTDVVIDKSSGKNVIFYDKKSEDNKILYGAKTKVKLSDKDYINEYEREAFTYDYVGPRLSLEINQDDGLYLGGGVKIETHGFRKEPAKSSHSILANYAFATSAFNFMYNGAFYSLFGRSWDLEIDGYAYGPKYIFNYFGQGNDTPKQEGNIDFYRINMDHVNMRPSINHRFNRFLTIGAGPLFSYYFIKDNQESILNAARFEQPQEVENAAYFAGAEIFSEVMLLDHPVDPSKGINWTNTFSYNKELNNNEDDFLHLSTDLALYYTPELPFRLTAALRYGAATNIGEYKFYQSNFLGGTTNLRGFRRTRFAGETTMFINSELRLGISGIYNYIFTGSWGLVGFFDTGRVWSAFDQSNQWHKGYGPGIWLNVFDMLMVSTHYGFSSEGNFFHLQMGHFF